MTDTLEFGIRNVECGSKVGMFSILYLVTFSYQLSAMSYQLALKVPLPEPFFYHEKSKTLGIAIFLVAGFTVAGGDDRSAAYRFADHVVSL